MPSRFRYSLLGAHFIRSYDVIDYVIFASKYNWVTISRSRDDIGHVIIGLPIPLFLFVLHCDQDPIYSPFRDVAP